MRTVLMIAVAMATGVPGLRAQLLSTMDTISVPRLVDHWIAAEGRDVPVMRTIEYILHNLEDDRGEELFSELVSLLRSGNMVLAGRTATILGWADSELPGRWTGELIQIAQDLVDERRDAASTTLISYGSPALKNQGRPLLIRRLRELSEERPNARYAAEILVIGLWDLPGAREELRGLYDRGEIGGAARFAVWGKLQRGGG